MNRISGKNIRVFALALGLGFSVLVESSLGGMKEAIICYIKDATTKKLSKPVDPRTRILGYSSPEANKPSNNEAPKENGRSTNGTHPASRENPRESTSPPELTISRPIEITPFEGSATSVKNDFPIAIRNKIEGRDQRLADFKIFVDGLQQTAKPTKQRLVKSKNPNAREGKEIRIRDNLNYINLKNTLRARLIDEISRLNLFKQRIALNRELNNTQLDKLSDDAARTLQDEIAKTDRVIEGLKAALNDPMLDPKKKLPIALRKLKQLAVIDHFVAFRLTTTGLTSKLNEVIPLDLVTSHQLAQFLDRPSSAKPGRNGSIVSPLEKSDIKPEIASKPRLLFIDDGLSLFEWDQDGTSHFGFCKGPCVFPDKVINQTNARLAIEKWLVKNGSGSDLLPKIYQHGYQLSPAQGLIAVDGKNTPIELINSHQLLGYFEQPAYKPLPNPTGIAPERYPERVKLKILFVDGSISLFEWSDPITQKNRLGYCKSPCAQPEKVLLNNGNIDAVKSWLDHQPKPVETLEKYLASWAKDSKNDTVSASLLTYYFNHIKSPEFETTVRYFEPLVNALVVEAQKASTLSDPHYSKSGAYKTFLNDLISWLDDKYIFAKRRVENANNQNLSTVQDRLGQYRSRMQNDLFSLPEAVGSYSNNTRKSMPAEPSTPGLALATYKTAKAHLEISAATLAFKNKDPKRAIEHLERAAQALKNAQEQKGKTLGTDEPFITEYISKLERDIKFRLSLARRMMR